MTPLDFDISLAREFGRASDPAARVSLNDEAAAVEFRLREIEPVWRTFDAFVFDFTGIDEISGGFAHALIGRLAEQYGSWLHDKVRIKNVAPALLPVLQIVISEGIRRHDSQPKA